jgi:hypothetical protein
MMNRLLGCLGVLWLVTSCAPIDADEAPGGASEALTLRAQPVELPTADELPDCWWADSEASCLKLCEEDDTAQLALRAPVQSGRATLAPPTLAVGGSGPVARGPTDLAAPEDDDCHIPDGVLPCPHCTTSLLGQTRIGDFWVSNGLGTHVVVANSLGKFRVAKFPALDASLLSVEGEPEIPGTHHVELDLLAGGEELAATAIEPSANQDLYLLFAFSGQAGQLPAIAWMRCPAQGTECEPYFP